MFAAFFVEFKAFIIWCERNTSIVENITLLLSKLRHLCRYAKQDGLYYRISQNLQSVRTNRPTYY